MRVIHMSSEMLEAIVEERRRTGVGRLDECWEGVWHLTDPTGKHQRIAFGLCRVFAEVVEDGSLGTAWISINVTDREEGWQRNHRCPDGAVILAGNPGRWLPGDVAFLGGPDLALEVRSEDDETFERFPFYAALGTREVLIVDQETFDLSLWRLAGGEYERVPDPPASEVTGLAFERKLDGIDVRHPATGRRWTVR